MTTEKQKLHYCGLSQSQTKYNLATISLCGVAWGIEEKELSDLVKNIKLGQEKLTENYVHQLSCPRTTTQGLYLMPNAFGLSGFFLSLHLRTTCLYC